MTRVQQGNSWWFLIRVCIVISAVSSTVFRSNETLAQNVPPPMRQEELSIQSGIYNGNGKDFHVAHIQTVGAGKAPWIQVHFGEVELGTKSFVRLTSVENGDQQTLDSSMLQHWNYSSGVFRGGRVTVELVVAPNDTDLSFQLNAMTVGENYIGGPEESLCDGDDDRVPSNDARVGRLFFGGCTAWLISNGAVLTAGHCFPIGGVMEFNVPASNFDGTPIPAAIEDQYPIDGAYAAFTDDGPGQVGRDWGVFSIGPNSQTGLRAHRVQGFIRCSNAIPLEGFIFRVTGFGIDDEPVIFNYIQQTDTGTYEGDDSDSDGIWLEYRVDTQPANSGSPVFWDGPGVAVAIHTNAGCDTSSSSFNVGTSFELDELENFMNMFWGDTVEHVDASFPLSSFFPADGSILRPWISIGDGVDALPAGGVLVLVEGSYDETVTINKAMTIQAPVGTVTIGE